MTEPKKIQIWRPETGIIGLPAASIAEIIPTNIDAMKQAWSQLKEKINAADAEIKSEFDARFNEKLYREWSIETGLIEGLYALDRGVTTSLIQHGFNDARLIPHGGSDLSSDNVLEIINNHLKVLEDGIYGFVKQERKISTSYIKELHQSITKTQVTIEAQDQSGRKFASKLLHGEWKTLPNFPVRDGIIYEYCPPIHVAAEMDRLIDEYNLLLDQKCDAIVRAAWLHHRFSQIHPFQDGNGRVARALASIVLIQDNLFPFTVTMERRADYLKALETADQTMNLTDSAQYLQPLIDFIAARQIKDYSQASLIAQELLTPKRMLITEFIANKEKQLQNSTKARELGGKFIAAIDLTPLRLAIASLQSAVTSITSTEYQNISVELRMTAQAGVVKNFEFVYALSHKYLLRYLMENSPDPSEVRELDFKDLMRLAADNGLIAAPENWFKWREFRNKTSHTYDNFRAQKLLTEMNHFLGDVTQLLRQLEMRVRQ